MFILDSDALTFIDGSRRNSYVSKWLETINETDVYLSVIAIFEKSKNAARLTKNGKAADAKAAEAALTRIKTLFANRIVEMDVLAAEEWGRMIGAREKYVFDVAVAAIAKRRGYTVATGNTKHYKDCGVALINPFKSK